MGFLIVVLGAIILCGCSMKAMLNKSNNEKNPMVQKLMNKKWVAKKVLLQIEFNNGDYLEIENIYDNTKRTTQSRRKEGREGKYTKFSDKVPYNVRVEEFKDNSRMIMKMYSSEDNRVLAENVHKYDINGDKIYIKLLPDESKGGIFYDVELHGVTADIHVSENEFTTITTLDSKFYEEIGRTDENNVKEMSVTATRVIQ